MLQLLRRSFSSAKAKGLIELTSASEFKGHLSSNPKVLVDFFAVWCGPCKVMAPVLEKTAQAQPEVSFVKVDIDQVPELAREFEITAVPTVAAFENGKLVNRFMGAKDDKFLQSFIKTSFKQ